MTTIIQNLSEISDHYDAMFVDLWGCLHDGYKPFLEATKALTVYRKKGGKVVLLTNAPRHRKSVEKQIHKIGIKSSCWDTIATSGDSARYGLFSGTVGNKIYFIGQPHDLNFFDPPSDVKQRNSITLVSLKEADGIVCCGPFDPLSRPDKNLDDLITAQKRGLKLLCANPDIVVDRGHIREWCAGALASEYTKLGGKSLYFGKPHKPIYDLARKRLINMGFDVPDHKILCVGDGILTDVAGALNNNLDSLFISGGLASSETMTEYQPDEKMLREFLKRQNCNPKWTIGKLR
jgi:HAD superfamily hydrolase (TIGR01459 family)